MLATIGCIVVSPVPNSTPTATATPRLTIPAVSLPTETPEPTDIPQEYGRFHPWPKDGTCYTLENSLCVGVRSVDWNASGKASNVEGTAGTRVYSSIGPRPPTGFKFVVIELYMFNVGNRDINTDRIWSNQGFHTFYLHRKEDKGIGIEVMGQGTDTAILDLRGSINPNTGEQDGCIVLEEPDIPESWVEGPTDIYVPPGGNLPWKLCFTVPNEDLSTLVLKWPHFIEGPAIWFALHSDQ